MDRCGRRPVSILLVLIPLVTGCGVYSFSGSSLPSHIKTLAVPIFENETLEYEVADEITEAVTQRFLKDNRLKIVSETRADAVIEGRLIGYENKVHNYSADEAPEDYIVVLRVAILFRDAVKNREVWKTDELVASEVYLVVGGSDEVLTDEEGARAQAISELAEDILARTMEQW